LRRSTFAEIMGDDAHDSDLSMRMNLALLLWQPKLVRAKCCGCVPLRLGGALVCLLTILQGACALFEAYEVDSLLMRNRNPYGTVWYVVLGLWGISFVVAGIIGAFGVLARSTNCVIGLFVWRVVCLLFLLPLSGCVVAFNTLGIGAILSVLVVALQLMLELFLLWVLFHTILLVYSDEHISDHLKMALNVAQGSARAHDHGLLDTIHLLDGLLEQPKVEGLLHFSGVDTSGFRAMVSSALRLGVDVLPHRPPKQDLAPLTSAARHTLSAALRIRYQYGDPKLHTYHMVLAAWDQNYFDERGGTAEHVLRSTTFKHAAALEEVDRLREESKPPLKPESPKVLGYLPLEETLIVYLALEIVFCLVSLICVLFYGHSIMWLFGLLTTHGLRVAEFWLSLVGVIFGVFALLAIGSHRSARSKIQMASSLRVGTKHAQELDVGEASHLLQGQPQVASWLKTMRVSAARLSLYLIFDMVRMFVCIPLVLMGLVLGNVCGAYVHGIANTSNALNIFSNVAPMHCTLNNVYLLICIVCIFALDLYMIWCILSLWHEYAFGWTTTDPKFAMYLDPFGCVDEEAWFWLAGRNKGSVNLSSGNPQKKQDHKELHKEHKEKHKHDYGHHHAAKAPKPKGPPRAHLVQAVAAVAMAPPGGSWSACYQKFLQEMRMAL